MLCVFFVESQYLFFFICEKITKPVLQAYGLCKSAILSNIASTTCTITNLHQETNKKMYMFEAVNGIRVFLVHYLVLEGRSSMFFGVRK